MQSSIENSLIFFNSMSYTWKQLSKLSDNIVDTFSSYTIINILDYFSKIRQSYFEMYNKHNHEMLINLSLNLKKTNPEYRILYRANKQIVNDLVNNLNSYFSASNRKKDLPLKNIYQNIMKLNQYLHDNEYVLSIFNMLYHNRNNSESIKQLTYLLYVSLEERYSTEYLKNLPLNVMNNMIVEDLLVIIDKKFESTQIKKSLTFEFLNKETLHKMNLIKPKNYEKILTEINQSKQFLQDIDFFVMVFQFYLRSRNSSESDLSFIYEGESKKRFGFKVTYQSILVLFHKIILKNLIYYFHKEIICNHQISERYRDILIAIVNEINNKIFSTNVINIFDYNIQLISSYTDILSELMDKNDFSSKLKKKLRSLLKKFHNADTSIKNNFLSIRLKNNIHSLFKIILHDQLLNKLDKMRNLIKSSEGNIAHISLLALHKFISFRLNSKQDIIRYLNLLDPHVDYTEKFLKKFSKVFLQKPISYLVYFEVEGIKLPGKYYQFNNSFVYDPKTWYFEEIYNFKKATRNKSKIKNRAIVTVSAHDKRFAMIQARRILHDELNLISLVGLQNSEEYDQYIKKPVISNFAYVKSISTREQLKEWSLIDDQTIDLNEHQDKISWLNKMLSNHYYRDSLRNAMGQYAKGCLEKDLITRFVTYWIGIEQLVDGYTPSIMDNISSIIPSITVNFRSSAQYRYINLQANRILQSLPESKFLLYWENRVYGEIKKNHMKALQVKDANKHHDEINRFLMNFKYANRAKIIKELNLIRSLKKFEIQRIYAERNRLFHHFSISPNLEQIVKKLESILFLSIANISMTTNSRSFKDLIDEINAPFI